MLEDVVHLDNNNPPAGHVRKAANGLNVRAHTLGVVFLGGSMYHDSLGSITLHRKLKNWGWYKAQDHAHVFIFLIMEARWKDGEYKGVFLKRGQLVTGRAYLSYHTGVSQRSIRTILNHLKSTNEVTIKSTNHGSIVTINNYDTYQLSNGENDQQSDQQSDQQVTSNRPASDQQVTTSNKVIRESCNSTYPPTPQGEEERAMAKSEPEEDAYVGVRRDEALANFEKARKIWPGKKRGLESEFENFCKKNNRRGDDLHDWRLMLDDDGLAQCVQELIDRNAYSPGYWPHFQTFINQRRWEEANEPPEVRK